MSPDSLAVTIRPAREADAAALNRLAALDSAGAPQDPVLVAELDGALVAAIGVHSGEVVADPFVPTADVVELLETRARRLEPRGAQRRLTDLRHGRRTTAARAA